MKKTLAFISAVAMLASMAVPFTAFAEDAQVKTVTQADELPASASTEVSYQVDSAYMVTIPAKVELGTDAVEASFKVSGAEADKPPILEKDKSIFVSLTDAANGFSDDKKLTVKTADGTGTATYQVLDENDKAVGKDDVIAQFDYDPLKPMEDYTKKATFTAPQNANFAGTYTDTLTFTVKVDDAATKVTGIAIQNAPQMAVKTGSTVTLSANVTPADATNKGVVWSSSDETVATVDQSGIVTAVNYDTTAGYSTVTITAEAADGSGAKAACEITVAEFREAEFTAYEMSISLVGDGFEENANAVPFRIEYAVTDTWADAIVRNSDYLDNVGEKIMARDSYLVDSDREFISANSKVVDTIGNCHFEYEGWF